MTHPHANRQQSSRSIPDNLSPEFESSFATVAENLPSARNPNIEVANVEQAANDTFNSLLKQDFVPVIRLFEQQAEKNAERIAFVYQHQQITFSELNRRANQAARFLIHHGVLKNHYVPVFIDRSIEMMVAMLAIFKAGAIYVPFDPAHPADRVEFMLNDLNATHVFATAATRQRLTTYTGLVIELFEKDAKTISDQSVENLSAQINTDDVAYVIYTSGSTGRPKGVMVQQAAMFHYMVNSSTRFIHGNDNLFGSYIHLSNTFDASLTSLFMPMLAGKSAVISSPSGGDAFNDDNFLKYAPYDFLNITPAHLDFLIPTVSDPANWVTQRLVIGGEALYTGHFDFFVENNVPLEIINLYGPTEATIGCTTYTFWLNEISKQSQEIPIGMSIDKTAIYLLQQEDGGFKAADTGEICIGGLTLALGYLNREELTNEKFIPNPVDKSEWPRLYRTGDLGKWLPDGNLAYCGRMDSQVKISGYRIELGEIESVCNAMTYVNNSCVLAQGESVKKLVCYVLPLYDKIKQDGRDGETHLGSTLETEEDYNERINQWLQDEIVKFLGERLPKYMVPSSFVFLKHFPLSSSGKIDRKALPALQNKVVRDVKPSREATPVEEMVIDVWQTVLGVNAIQVNDNFFEIGGNSIQAARMFNLVRKQTGRQLPVSTLVTAPMVEQLARLLTEPNKKGASEILVPFRTSGTRPPLFLIHGGAGDVLFYKELATLLPADQPVYGIMPRGLDGKEAPISSVEKMAAFYINKIKVIQPTGPYYLGGYCFGATVAVEMAEQLKLKGEQIAFLANINGIAPGYVRGKVAQKLPIVDSIIGRINQRRMTNDSKFKLIATEFSFQLKCLKAFMIYKLYWKGAVTLLVKMNVPLSALLAKGYYFNTNDEMVLKHKLETYKGDLFLFRSPMFAREHTLGWAKQINGKITVHEIPGDHSDRQQILRQPYVKDLAKAIEQSLQLS